MKKITITFFTIILLIIIGVSCSKEIEPGPDTDPYAAIKAAFGTNIDLNNLSNYANQTRPPYLNPAKDNTGANPITNAKATLGRVLFYDKNLSIDKSVSCGSCHKQQFAFGDNAIVSRGVAGAVTARHSMRLVNARFGVEAKFFWDERAATLEQQTTKPIQDHAEMGFSGQNGRPGITTLLANLQAIDYYKELFSFVYGNNSITEARLQECLAQFVRSIQSFDSKYDAGRVRVQNDRAPFPNFTQQENLGKQLFLTAPVFDAQGVRTNGGAGCNSCHNAPEFDIDPNTRNNGMITPTFAGGNIDINVTRAPTLRDLVNPNGDLNGGLMHNAIISYLDVAVGHYNTINIVANNPNIDPRLTPGGVGQQLNLSTEEISAIVAFIKTLSGHNVYTDKKWSNPFL